MAQAERSFRQRCDFAGAEFDHFQGAFVGYGAQGARSYKASAVAAQRSDGCGNFGGGGEKICPRFREMSDEFAELREIFGVGDALSGQHHVGEGAGHGEAAVVHGIIKDKGEGSIRIARAELRHGASLVAGDYEVADFTMAVERAFEKSDAFRALAGA